jgi:hypothetical protein
LFETKKLMYPRPKPVFVGFGLVFKEIHLINLDYKTRFLRTKHRQLMQFDPHAIKFETKHGKNEENGAKLTVQVHDSEGVSIKSEKMLQLATAGNFSLVSDQKVLLTAGKEISLKCKTSGLKINQNILRSGADIYEHNKSKLTGAPEPNEINNPKGSGGGGGVSSKPAPAPTPASTPAPASANEEEKSKNSKDDQKKYYLGADGQKHYFDPERLFQCQLNAYNNSAFNKDSHGTYCNRFAESVLQQYTGSKELMGPGAAKMCVDIYAHISKSAKWKSCNAVAAETKAREGYFVVGITTTTMSSKLPNHIAVVCPKGNGVVRRGIKCPSIAQQGKFKIIFGKDDNYTANFGWDRDSVGQIRYYYKIPDSKLQ